MLVEAANNVENVVNIITQAGGEIIGKTRLQKVTYMLFAAGFENNFDFTYKRYGPFSENLYIATDLGVSLGKIKQTEQTTKFGTPYFIYTVNENKIDINEPRAQLTQRANQSKVIDLELAATALYLFKENQQIDPWQETRKRKPEKTQNGELDRAYKLFGELKNIVPNELPDLPKPNIAAA